MTLIRVVPAVSDCLVPKKLAWTVGSTVPWPRRVTPTVACLECKGQWRDLVIICMVRPQGSG